MEKVRALWSGLVLAALAGGGALAQAEAGGGSAPPEGFLDRYFRMVEKTQDAQPHWISPLVTTTPRLNERFRYDFAWQSRPNDVDLANYGNSKGIELILATRVAMTFGIPGYVVRDSPRGTQSGWADETFLLKYRFFSANEESGNSVFSAFLNVSVPTGSDAFRVPQP